MQHVHQTNTCNSSAFLYAVMQYVSTKIFKEVLAKKILGKKQGRFNTFRVNH